MADVCETIIKDIREGHHVFITGVAGVGKSTVAREITRNFPDTIVLAPTGVAAKNIQGRTIHNFLGIGPQDRTAEEWLQKVYRNMGARTRIREVVRILIDEISMVSADFFDNIGYVLSKIRSNSAPFGGVQIIAIGDFHQLPPIIDKTIADGPVEVDGVILPEREQRVFAFESELWNMVFLPPSGRIHLLTKIHRQLDPEFQRILCNVRLGTQSARDIAILAAPRGEAPDGTITIACKNKTVCSINATHLRRLAGPESKYGARYSGHESIVKDLTSDMKSMDIDQAIYKPGARVMLRRNIDAGLVNGSLGVVTVCLPDEIHVRMDLPGGGPGSVYAFGRASWDRRRKAVTPDEKRLQDAEGYITAKVEQFPLTLAWAITVHKSQGLTFERARVDLAECFEVHQAYVALSRVRDFSGLYCVSLDASRIMSSSKVKKFYHMLSGFSARP